MPTREQWSQGLGWLAGGCGLYIAVRYVTASAGLWHTERHDFESAWLVLAILVLLSAVLAVSDRPAEESRPGELIAVRVVLPLTILAVLALYWPSLSVGELSDDFVLLSPGWRSIFTVPAQGFFRPLPVAIWALAGFLKASPVALHALNLILHACNATLLALVGGKMGLSKTAALTAAAFFLVIPTSVEAVTWLACLPELLMAGACLVGVLLIHDRRPSRVRMFPLSVVAAILSKETGVVAPFVALVTRLAVPASQRRVVTRILLVSVALVSGFTLWHMWAIPTSPEFRPHAGRYYLKELLVRTFWSLASPWSDVALERAAWLSGLSLCFCLLLSYAGLRAWRRDRRVLRVFLTSLAIALLAVVPVYGILYVSPSLQGSRYLYLPAAGWALAVASVLAQAKTLWQPVRAAITTAAVVMLTSMAGACWLQQQDWRRAAAVRDMVSADLRAHASDCDPNRIRIDNLPDFVGAAYLFRVGAKEAIARAFIGTPTSAESGVSCHFEYTSAGIVRKE